MLKPSLYELLLKGIPESFLMVSLFYILSKTKFVRVKYIVISILSTMFTFIIRQFDFTSNLRNFFNPDSSSANLMIYIILHLIFIVIIMMIFNRAKLLPLVIAGILVTVTISLAEVLNGLFLLVFLSQQKIQYIINHNSTNADAFMRTIAFIPSTVFLIIFTSLTYYLMIHLDKRKLSKQEKKVEVDIYQE